MHKQLGFTPVALFGEQSIQTIGAEDDRHEVLRYGRQHCHGQVGGSQLPCSPGQQLGGEPKGLVGKIELEKA